MGESTRVSYSPMGMTPLKRSVMHRRMGIFILRNLLKRFLRETRPMGGTSQQDVQTPKFGPINSNSFR